VRRAIVVAILLLAAGYAGWTFSRRGRADVCTVCNREIHAHGRITGASGGRRVAFCCLACARSQHQQSGRPVRLAAIPDYFSGRPVDPATAYAVEGSDVVPCGRHQPHLDENKHPTALGFDRCVPSLLAFASREGAAAFAREHGGRLTPIREFTAALARE